MLKNHKVIRLVDLLETEDGESFYKTLTANFSSTNKDVESFLKEKAVQSVKLCTSSTYLVISKDNPNDLLGYFSLATKVLTLKKLFLSKSTEKIIKRYGYYDDDSDSYKIPAILIAQFGKNYSEKSESIQGSILMSIALQQIKTILSFSSGKTAFLECEKKQALIEFYKNHNFIILDNEILSKNHKELIQMYRLV